MFDFHWLSQFATDTSDYHSNVCAGFLGERLGCFQCLFLRCLISSEPQEAQLCACYKYLQKQESFSTESALWLYNQDIKAKWWISRFSSSRLHYHALTLSLIHPRCRDWDIRPYTLPCKYVQKELASEPMFWRHYWYSLSEFTGLSGKNLTRF